MFYKKPQNLTLLLVISENKTRVYEKFIVFLVSFQPYYALIAQIVMGVSEERDQNTLP